MPSGLPTTSPSVTPSVIGLDAASPMRPPESGTPAFANAKIGTMR
jgi:hypothetical protein